MVINQKNPFEVDKKVVDELLLVCGVIGSTVDPETQTIVPVEDCLNWLQDLQRALRRDEDAYRPISLLLGQWKVVEQKLLPLVVSCRYDTALVITLLKILVILTKPISESAKRASKMVIDVKTGKVPKDVVQEQIRLRENAIAQLELLTQYKRLFVHHISHRCVSSAGTGDEKRGLFSVFVSLMTVPLSKTGVARTSEDHLTIELVLHLFRNLLCAGDCRLNGSYGDKAIQDSTALHLEMIQLLDRELVLDILLVIGQEIDNRENKQYNLLVMEILHHLLKIQDPVLVARSSLVNNAKPLKKKSIIQSSGLKSKLEAERHRVLSATSSRHSHFGGTLALQKQNGKVHYLQASVDSLLSVQSGVSASMMINTAEERRKSKKHHVFVGSGRELALHTRPGISVTSVMQDMGPSNHRANQVLHKFCEKFMDHCYGPVMKSLKNEFRRDSNRLEDGDLRIFFRIIWFFCQWWRVGLKNSSCDGIGPLIVTMDIFMFKRVVKATDHFYDHKKFFDLAQAVALYSEMMHLLNAMYHAKDSTEQVMAFGLMDQLFYHPEPMDILPKLLSRWIPGTFTREYLCDLLELSHVTLKLLDSNAELCAPYLTQKGSKKKRSKNPEESTAEPKDAVSHMKAIASEFDVKSYFTRKLVTNQVVYMYGHLLSHYDVNAVHINKHIIAFFVRLEKVEISSYDSIDDVGNDASASVANLEPMLFNVPILTVLNKILCDKNLRNKVEEEFLLTFATGLIRHYVAFAERNPMLYVETLFRHPLPLRFCESSCNMYVTDEMRMIAERDALLEKRKNEDDLPRMEQEQRPFMTSADDDDDGEIEFDQRFGDSFEARGVYVSKNKSKLGKKNQTDKGGRTAVSPSDSEVDRDDDSSVQKSENDEEEGIETVDEKRNSKRVAVDEEEQISPLEKGDVGKLRKRVKRVTSNDSSDDEDGIIVESDRVVIKPNWAEDDDERKVDDMAKVALAFIAYYCFKTIGSDNAKSQALSIHEKFRELEHRADLGFGSLADAKFQFQSSLLSTLWSNCKSTLEQGHKTMAVLLENRRFTETEQQKLNLLNKSSRYNISSHWTPELSDLITDLQASRHEEDDIISKWDGVLPLFAFGYSNYTESQGTPSFVDLFETSKSAELSALNLKSDAEKASIAHRSSAQAQSWSIMKNALVDGQFWKRFYDWKTSPVSETDALTIIDAVQLNRVKNHFSPYFHVESTLPRRYSNRILPQYTADLDLESSARIFPLNIAQDMSMSESSILFLQNIKALSAIGSLVDDTVAEFNVIENIISHRSPSVLSIDEISSMVFGIAGESFESAQSLHATAISLEHVVLEKQIRLKVDQIAHVVSTHVLNLETEQRLHSIDASASSKTWIQNLHATYHHEHSMKTIFTEMILDTVKTTVVHAHNLYILAHEYSRSLAKIVEEGKASVSFHRAEIHAEAANERKLEFITLDRIKIIGEEGRRTVLHGIDICSAKISNSLVFLVSTRDGVHSALLLLGFLLVLVFSLSFVRHVVVIAVALARKAFLMPTLIRESRRSASFLTWKNRPVVPNIILPRNYQRRLSDLINAISSARANGAALKNILIHGPPGSGKTLLTRHLLQHIPDAPYIIMSGADLVPLGLSAPIELKRIISWAIRSKGIIVIDEAECALRRRFSQTNNHSTSDSADAAVARDIINVFLSLTGEASSDLMLIMVTCHPEMLDDAILDRCDEVFRLTLPMQNERLIIIQECFSEKFGPGNIRGRGKQPCPYSTKFDMELFHKLSSDDTEGFSGREINQIVKGIYEEALLTDEGLTECIWEQVSKRMCYSIKMKKRVLSE